jgi:hypothetical protein
MPSSTKGKSKVRETPVPRDLGRVVKNRQFDLNITIKSLHMIRRESIKTSSKVGNAPSKVNIPEHCDLKTEALSDTISVQTQTFVNNLVSRTLTVSLAVMSRTGYMLTNFENPSTKTKTACYTDFKRNTCPK